MPAEIEKKFLILEDDRTYEHDNLHEIYETVEALKDDILSRGMQINQGYMDIIAGKQLANSLNIQYDFDPVEVRLRDRSGIYFLTLKGEGSSKREEKEVRIPKNIFNENWNLTEGRRILKKRLEVSYKNFIVEIDVHQDRNLIVAEIEVPTEADLVGIPILGLDITEDPKYKNINLAK